MNWKITSIFLAVGFSVLVTAAFLGPRLFMGDSDDAFTDSPRCLSVVTSLKSVNTCDQQWEGFERGLEECQGHLINLDGFEVSYEQHAMDIARCFASAGQTDRAVEIYRRSQEWPDWEDIRGPRGCPGKMFAEAALEAMTREGKTCLSKQALLAQTAKNVAAKDWASMFASLPRGAMVLSGSEYFSDDACEVPVNTLVTMLNSSFETTAGWKIAPEEGSSKSFWVGIRPPEETSFNIIMESDANGCVHWAGVYFTSPE